MTGTIPVCSIGDLKLIYVRLSRAHFKELQKLGISGKQRWMKCWHQLPRLLRILLNKHIMIDLGTGNNNKINWALKDKQEFIDIVETVYRGARKGRGLVTAPKDYSTKYRY
ncbi:hypothetical protein LWI29_028080 [Acer saccharum]|uniref:Uncharacterized protein n=1 Tax=Acer saccharum TaxID=4024 RepID=A0AA39VC33_ACESA|nr:hypothetical protein LWI29_028080 [Acer saccharum]